MSAIERRLLALEQAHAPKARPLLMLLLHEAGKSDSEPLSIDGVAREPRESWDTYKARAALWHEQNRGDGCLVVMKVRYAE